MFPAVPGMSKRPPAAMPEAVGNKKRFTAAAQNRFANDVQAMAARQQAALREEGIKDVVDKLRQNPSLIAGCQVFLASGGLGVRDDFPRGVRTSGVKLYETY